ncbi:zinc transporter ZIP13-like [Panonychus citri]|uniref:zinc transporter ZIP13-like n=1 Tax=Panonychus citri TaxID=50023 RepID=UPI0023082E97|nr:zinc transporter ZIP13-like [Panonychus citri]
MLPINSSFSQSLESLNPIWWFSLSAAATVGLVGVIPIFFISYIPQGKNQGSNSKLRLLLSFSVGGLLGDVFLHLLPEAWTHVHRSGSSIDTHTTLGLWVVTGISTFLTIEMIFLSTGSTSKGDVNNEINKTPSAQIVINSNQNKSKCIDKTETRTKDETVQSSSGISVTGYLSVFANGVDNFTHGLAIAASFSAGFKIGVLTTIAILIHEVPHEFGDFAILMKSGFSRWKAIQAQILTAVVAMIGALVALIAESNASEVGKHTQWILPYSAGCFLYIAMSNILPDLMKEDNPRESVKQLICITIGITIMGLVNQLGDISFTSFL